ncbi:MAG: site-specific DNA-methyltransferase [Parvibaculum sp.]
MAPASVAIPDMFRPLLTPLAQLKENPRNARTHSRAQVKKLATVMRRVGWLNPIIADETGMVLAGHGRLLAAQLLGLVEAPVAHIDYLTEAQKRAYVLADNQIASLAGWDRGILAAEIGNLALELPSLDLSISDLGFSPGEINLILTDRGPERGDPADEPPSVVGAAATRPGSHWSLGPLQHEIVCGDSRDLTTIAPLLRRGKVDMAFVDKPYNVPVRGHVQGRGQIQHDEFAMASGEMSREEFRAFARLTDEVIHSAVKNGGLVYSCVDWRSIDLFIEVGREVFGTLLNVVVWNKTNAGQGSLYRSQHELIPVFKVGDAPHCNAVELGRHGRNRSNVWTFPGTNGFHKGRQTALESHPTVKPVALVAEAMKDCTLPGETILDTFLGSGTTLMAAEKVGRRCLGVEIEPKFVDVAVRRWQSFTGLDAFCVLTGRTFDEISDGRPSVAPEGEAP